MFVNRNTYRKNERKSSTFNLPPLNLNFSTHFRIWISPQDYKWKVTRQVSNNWRKTQTTAVHCNPHQAFPPQSSRQTYINVTDVVANSVCDISHDVYQNQTTHARFTNVVHSHSHVWNQLYSQVSINTNYLLKTNYRNYNCFIFLYRILVYVIIYFFRHDTITPASISMAQSLYEVGPGSACMNDSDYG